MMHETGQIRDPAFSWVILLSSTLDKNTILIRQEVQCSKEEHRF